MDDYYARRAYDNTNEIQRDVRRLAEAQRANHASLATAFNRMADVLETLVHEVRQLREDLNPKTLDKPQLPRPEGGA